MDTVHISVMKRELVDAILSGNSQGNFVDATLGGGGHTLELASQLDRGQILGIDTDQLALDRVTELLRTANWQQKDKAWEKGNVKLVLVNSNFKNIKEIIAINQFPTVDGIFADLGISSDQLLDLPGISFQNESDELDMRMDRSKNNSAADILNDSSFERLIEIWMTFGDFDLRKSEELSKAVMEQRKVKQFAVVADLNNLISNVLPSAINSPDYSKNDKHGKAWNPLLARVYQALRMAVNAELESLQTFLNDAFSALSQGGRLVIITFHSGEEKIVSDFFARLSAEGSAQNLFSDGYLRPSVIELRKNLRARSAKLFAYQKK